MMLLHQWGKSVYDSLSFPMTVILMICYVGLLIWFFVPVMDKPIGEVPFFYFFVLVAIFAKKV